MTTLHGHFAVEGTAAGPLVVSREPLSFWGGYDAATGTIIDQRHPLAGARAAGSILVMPWTRGSSTTTAVLLEAVRLGQAPAAVVLPQADTFIALASIVAGELYGRPFPVLVLSEEDWRSLPEAGTASIGQDGSIICDV